MIRSVPYGGEDPANQVPDQVGWYGVEVRCWCGAVQDLHPVENEFRCAFHRKEKP